MNINDVRGIVPLLIVRDAARAIDFYSEALGAREVSRCLDRSRSTVSHADLAIGGAVFSVTEEARAWNSDAPPSLGGSPVVLQLQVEDVDVAFDRMVTAGAEVVFPLIDFCGDRMGRCATRSVTCGSSRNGSRSCQPRRSSGGGTLTPTGKPPKTG